VYFLSGWNLTMFPNHLKVMEEGTSAFPMPE
jgi:hypothetical protein